MRSDKKHLINLLMGLLNLDFVQLSNCICLALFKILWKLQQMQTMASALKTLEINRSFCIMDYGCSNRPKRSKKFCLFDAILPHTLLLACVHTYFFP